MAGTLIATARERLWSMRADLERARDTAVQGQHPSDDAIAWPVALVPMQRARVRRTAGRRQQAFLTRLRALVATVRRTTGDEDDRTLDAPEALSPLAARVVAATCSACRGACCANGGDHAFLRTRTIREFMATHPALDDEGVVEAYRAWLPARTSHPGCVYQAATGCTLPRQMRSAICNAYLCSGLRQALLLTTSETRGVYVAQRDGNDVRGGWLRALPVLAVFSQD
jgi:hypothetical protein